MTVCEVSVGGHSVFVVPNDCIDQLELCVVAHMMNDVDKVALFDVPELDSAEDDEAARL